MGNNQYIGFWTENEIEFLKNNYLKLSSHQLAQRLNRTYSSVRHKLTRLKLKTEYKKFEDAKKKMSETRKLKIKNGSKDIKIFKGGKENIIHNPIIKEKARQRIKAYWKNEDVRKKMSKKIKELYKKGVLKPNKYIFKKGHIPHSKGKTKENYEPLKKASEKIRGREFSLEHRKKISTSKKGKKNIKVSLTRIKLHREGKIKVITPIKNSSIEMKIQGFLKEMGIKFISHKHIKIPYGYQCDIFIPSMNLVIECDGDYWHKYPLGTEKDYIRSMQLYVYNFKLIRLWEHEIKELNLEDFKKILFDKNYYSQFIKKRIERGVRIFNEKLL